MEGLVAVLSFRIPMRDSQCLHLKMCERVLRDLVLVLKQPAVHSVWVGVDKILGI